MKNKFLIILIAVILIAVSFNSNSKAQNINDGKLLEENIKFEEHQWTDSDVKYVEKALTETKESEVFGHYLFESEKDLLYERERYIEKLSEIGDNFKKNLKDV